MLTDPVSWYFSLDKTQTIEFWVAFGTILLALVTVGAVIVSLSQNSAEHNRFEQGYAPLLEILHFNVQGNLFNEISLQNTGYGPALKIDVKLSGTWLKKHYEELPPYTGGERPQPRTERLSFNIAATHSVMVAGEAWGFYIKRYGAHEALDKEGLETEVAFITYEDRFCNEYATRYTDFIHREFEWVRPRKFGGKTRVEKGLESDARVGH